MSKSVITLFVSLVLLGWSVPVHGQIINVQSYMFQKKSQGFHWTVAGAGDYRRGTVEYTKYNISSAATANLGRHTVLLFGGYEFAENRGVDYINTHLEHFRYRFRLNSWLYVEAFLQHEYNEFKRLTLRAIGGAGPSISVPLSKKVQLVAGSSYMYEVNEYSNSGGGVVYGDSGESPRFNRWNNYMMLHSTVRKGVRIIGSAYYQPDILDFGNFLFLAELSIEVDLNKWLKISLTGSVAHNSEPPETIEKTDTRVIGAIGFDLDPFLK